MKKYVAVALHGGFIDDCSMKIFQDHESANAYIVKLFAKDLLWWFDDDLAEIMNEIKDVDGINYEVADGYICYQNGGDYHEYYVYAAEEV